MAVDMLYWGMLGTAPVPSWGAGSVRCCVPYQSAFLAREIAGRCKLDPAQAMELGINKAAARPLDTLPQGKQPSEPCKAESNRMFQKAMEDLSAVQNGHLADNAPERAIKHVTVDGRLVAAIYESGVATMTSLFADSLRNLALPIDRSSQLAVPLDEKRPEHDVSAVFFNHLWSLVKHQKQSHTYAKKPRPMFGFF